METVIRVTLIYLFVFVGLRLLGKREFSQLSALDLVTLLLVPEIVSQAITRDDYSLTNAFVAVATLFCLVFVTSTLTHRFRRVDRIVNGEPTLLVAHGKLLAKNCDRERISADEIFHEMHHNGLDTIESVRWAILKVDGKISRSCRRRSEHRAFSPSRAHLPASPARSLPSRCSLSWEQLDTKMAPIASDKRL